MWGEGVEDGMSGGGYGNAERQEVRQRGLGRARGVGGWGSTRWTYEVTQTKGNR